MWKPIALLAIVVATVIAFGSVGNLQPASAGVFLPPAGIDELEVNGQVTLDLSLVKLGTETVPLSGHMAIERSDPVGGTMDIEILSMSLSGESNFFGPGTPIIIELNPFAGSPATGQMNFPKGLPGDSFFDVPFMDIQIGGLGHFAQQPTHMSGTINGIPPFGDKYSSDPLMMNPIQDNLDPERTVGFLTDFNINIKGLPQKLFSITVLKIDELTRQPLPDWEFNIFDGPGCEGLSFESGFTGPDGIIDFVGLKAGPYSVQETLQDGWINNTPLCQDAELGQVMASGFVPCPTQPDLAFPDAGCDTFNSGGRFFVRLAGTDIREPVTLNGPTVIERSAVGDSNGNGWEDIQTEIIQLDLSGDSPLGPLTVRQSPTTPSTGLIEEQTNPTGELDFPADSFFDVFFEVDTALGTLHNEQALRLECKIDEIPPIGCFYQPPVPEPVPLLNEQGVVIAFLEHALHIPLPPNEILLVFSNEPKLSSITVLKLNGITNAPLPGWEFNLYEGPGCLGVPMESGFTGGNGIISFTRLTPGLYSVQEKLQDGWEAKTDLCQDVNLAVPAVTVAGVVGLPACPTTPNLAFPDPGCDDFDSGAQVNVRLNATGDVFAVTLNGPTLIDRGPVIAGTLDKIETEIVAMNLTGSSPTLGDIIVRESAAMASTGLITEQTNGLPGELEFPADSFFDVFFEIELAGMSMTLHNEDPLRLECKIDEIPPVLCFYQPPIGDPIVLVDEDGVKVATIVHAMHIPLPPNEVLVVFRNNPLNVLGDVDCDKDVDVIDALLILQLQAELISDLPCLKNADVNGIGEIDVIDALLILQLNAELITEFPGPP